jgi:ADP-ribose pyrophosphatase
MMDLTIEKQIERTSILQRDWLAIHVDTVAIEETGNVAERIVVEHPGAACILALTDANEVVLVEQYRYAASTALYEIPAGKNDTWDANTEETARRELAEETPYTAGKLELLYDFYIAPGYSDERIALYKATALKQNSTLSPDEDEVLHVKLCQKAEVRAMLRDGRIRDAKTIIALQYWLYEDE